MSYQAEIGQKIKEAIDFYLTQADSARLAAQLISDYWGERDYRWLAEAGVITQAEANAMLGVEPNRSKRRSRKPKRNGLPPLSRELAYKIVTSDYPRSADLSRPSLHAFVPVSHQTGCKSCGHARGEHPSARDAKVLAEASAVAHQQLRRNSRKPKRTSRRAR